MPQTGLSIRLYGPMNLSSSAEPVELPTAKARLLLAYLLLQPGHAETRRALIGLFWPELPDTRGLANLSTLLSMMRRALPVPLRGLIEADAQMVRLRADLIESDVGRVALYLQRVAVHRHRSVMQCLICIDDYRAALELMRGPLLSGLNQYDHEQLQHWIDATREVYRRQMIEVLEQLVLHTGLQRDWTVLIGYAERLLQEDIWHEQALQQLMQAYAASGRRFTALQRYERFCRDLRRELHSEPLAETRQLAAELQRGSWAAPARSVQPDVERLYGRQAELRALIDLIGQPGRRLVTISGLGGVGKTLLAQTAARQLAPLYRDGVVFVALDSSTDTERVIPAIAQACGIQLSNRRPALEQVAEALTAREVVLLLDNTEQIAGFAELISTLLRATEQPVLVITSRRPLQLWQESVIVLDGFSVEADDDHDEDERAAALALFSDRLARSGGTALPIDEPQMLAICRAVGGLPLAIELAAMRMHWQTADELLRQLQHGGDALFSAAPDLPARQRQLALIFAQAWHELSPVQQQHLADLTVISGEANEAVLQAVLGPNALESLQMPASGGLVTWRQRRVTLHPLLRQLVQQQQLDVSAARERHAAYFLQQLIDADLRVIDGPSRARAVRLAESYDNLQQAWRYRAQAGGGAQLSRLFESMLVLFICQGWYSLGADLFETTAALCDGDAAAACLIAAGRLRLSGGEYLAARRLARAARQRSTAAQITAEAAGLRATVLIESGRFMAAYRMASIGLRWCGNPHSDLHARLEFLTARGLMWQGRLPEAQLSYERVLATARRLQNRGLEIDCLNVLAQFPARAGDLAGSLPLLEAAAAETMLHGEVQAQITALVNVGAVRAVLQREPETAIAMLQQALQLARRNRNRRDLVSVLHSVAYGLIHLARLDEAANLLAEGIELALQIDHAPFILEMIEGIGLLAVQRGELVTADRLLSVVAEHERTAEFVRQRAKKALQQHGLSGAVTPAVERSASVLGQLAAEDVYRLQQLPASFG